MHTAHLSHAHPTPHSLDSTCIYTRTPLTTHMLTPHHTPRIRRQGSAFFFIQNNAMDQLFNAYVSSQLFLARYEWDDQSRLETGARLEQCGVMWVGGLPGTVTNLGMWSCPCIVQPQLPNVQPSSPTPSSSCPFAALHVSTQADRPQSSPHATPALIPAPAAAIVSLVLEAASTSPSHSPKVQHQPNPQPARHPWPRSLDCVPRAGGGLPPHGHPHVPAEAGGGHRTRAPGGSARHHRPAGRHPARDEQEAGHGACRHAYVCACVCVCMCVCA